jgi:hypothetical protein
MNVNWEAVLIYGVILPAFWMAVWLSRNSLLWWL